MTHYCYHVNELILYFINSERSLWGKKKTVDFNLSPKCNEIFSRQVDNDFMNANNWRKSTMGLSNFKT